MSVIGSIERRQCRQTGYTLLEVLVAAVLLTTGLIGLASMQVNGTRLNNSAYLRSQATILAYDIVDRMRANIPAARAGSYDLALADATPTATTSVPDIDLGQWRTAVAYNLPAGSSSVARVAGISPDDPSQFTVTVQWNDGRDPADVVNFTITTNL
ncbi:MAG: type IV pilus modification protein PilV [Pseudomonadota bacterium]